MIERLDKSLLAGSPGTDLDAFVESDLKIRSGLCPNDHGLMTSEAGLQHCPVCKFTTNKAAELLRQ